VLSCSKTLRYSPFLPINSSVKDLLARCSSHGFSPRGPQGDNPRRSSQVFRVHNSAQNTFRQLDLKARLQSWEPHALRLIPGLLFGNTGPKQVASPLEPLVSCLLNKDTNGDHFIKV
jgi:hypothetical protein